MEAIRPITDGLVNFGRVSAQREADDQPDEITDPGVYRVLDGIMFGRETTPTNPNQRAARRRRAVQRSQTRVPYGE